MALQKSLFNGDTPVSATTPVAVAGKAGTLTREQKQFNKLIAQVAAARRDLAQWRAFVDEMQRRQASEVSPLLTRLREQRKALLAIYDRTMAGTQLSRRERLKLTDILCAMLGSLLEERAEPELIALYDKYSDMSYEEEQAFESELMAGMASEVFGVKLGQDDVAGSPEESARRIAEKVEEAELAREERRAARARKKNPKAAEREAQQEAKREAAREQAAKNITQSVREVYRKLASELHPDREPDAAERERKTTLMQKVNKAYEEGDLLTLLELQLELEQINPDDLATMARERLLRFNAVLVEQLQRVCEEVSEITAPYVMAMDVYSARGVTPAQVRQSFEVELSAMRESLRSVEHDVHDHRDIKKLKQALKHYQMGMLDRGGMDELDDLMALAEAFPDILDEPPRRGGGRKRGRRR